MTNIRAITAISFDLEKFGPYIPPKKNAHTISEVNGVHAQKVNTERFKNS